MILSVAIQLSKDVSIAFSNVCPENIPVSLRRRYVVKQWVTEYGKQHLALLKDHGVLFTYKSFSYLIACRDVEDKICLQESLEELENFLTDKTRYEKRADFI